MVSKLLYISYYVLLILNMVSCRSFTLVVDTTLSMQDEIEIIKSNLPYASNLLANNMDFDSFVVVPFNDQDVGTPIIASNPENLLDSLNSIAVGGGHECPEDSLSGILRGLEVSKPESNIFVFTDAYAKEDSKFRDIERLCRSSQSQVSIFLSGSCPSNSGQPGNVDVYYDVARACAGAVFRFDGVILRKGFKYINEMIKMGWNDVTHHNMFDGYKEFMFSVDSLTTDFIIAISGEYPILQIISKDGVSPEIQKIVDTRHSLVVRLSNPVGGEYKASVRCEGYTYLTFYKKTQIPFQYGFSTRAPRSLKETSLRPIPGWTNYILLVLPENYNLRIMSLVLEIVETNERTSVVLEEHKTKKGYYICSAFVEPSKAFRLTVTGEDLLTNENISRTSKVIEPQTVKEMPWKAPTSELIDHDNNLIDFGTSATFACKVNGNPKPLIIWEDDSNNKLKSEDVLLEIPSISISYLELDNVTSNFTIYCKSKNAKGEDVQSMQVYVHREFTFEVMQAPSDQTIEYGKEGKLYCKVNAYPEAQTKWYHNETAVDYANNLEIIPEENSLVIKNMNLNDVGTYTCEVTNEANTQKLSAVVTISGLEAPQIEVFNTELMLKPGDWVDVDCRLIKGIPVPNISWQYSSNGIFFGDLPSEVLTEENKLKIPVVKVSHKGTYRCLASNILGEKSVDVTVKIQYAPKISNTDESTVEVKEGDVVELQCDVDAIPEARVRWEMTQSDDIVSLDHRHITDDRYTHRFDALWKDSGNYHCIAENDIGKTEKSITVNVLVTPYIQPPEHKSLTISEGSELTLDCNVLYGNPEPTTKWEFIPQNSTITLLSRGSSKNTLHVRRVTKADEGMYICVADNDIGNDRIRINVHVECL